jgi:hypothetical protein
MKSKANVIKKPFSLPKEGDDDLDYFESTLTNKEISLYNRYHHCLFLCDFEPKEHSDFQMLDMLSEDIKRYWLTVYENKELKAKVLFFHTISFNIWRDGYLMGTKRVRPNTLYYLIIDEQFIHELDFDFDNKFEFRYKSELDLDNDSEVYSYNFIDTFIKLYEDFLVNYEIPRKFKIYHSKGSMEDFVHNFLAGNYKRKKTKELKRRAK